MLEIQLRHSLDLCFYSLNIHRFMLRTLYLTSPDNLYLGVAYVEAV